MVVVDFADAAFAGVVVVGADWVVVVAAAAVGLVAAAVDGDDGGDDDWACVGALDAGDGEGDDGVVVADRAVVVVIHVLPRAGVVVGAVKDLAVVVGDGVGEYGCLYAV